MDYSKLYHTVTHNPPLPDAAKIVPGVRQDHNGQLYRIAQDNFNNQYQVPAPTPELSSSTKRAMTKVTVTSMAFRAAQGLTPKNAVQAAKLQAILDRGPTYESLACYQGGNF